MFLATHTMLAMHRTLRDDRLAAIRSTGRRRTPAPERTAAIRMGRTVVAR